MALKKYIKTIQNRTETAGAVNKSGWGIVSRNTPAKTRLLSISSPISLNTIVVILLLAGINPIFTQLQKNRSYKNSFENA